MLRREKRSMLRYALLRIKKAHIARIFYSYPLKVRANKKICFGGTKEVFLCPLKKRANKKILIGYPSVKIFLLAPRSILCAAKKKNEHTKEKITTVFPSKPSLYPFTGFLRLPSRVKSSCWPFFLRDTKRR